MVSTATKTQQNFFNVPKRYQKFCLTSFDCYEDVILVQNL